MSRFYAFFALLIGLFCFGQQITIQHALTTKDQKVMIEFLKQNPTHSEAPAVRQRLRDALSGKVPAPMASKTAKTASSSAEGLAINTSARPAQPVPTRTAPTRNVVDDDPYSVSSVVSSVRGAPSRPVPASSSKPARGDAQADTDRKVAILNHLFAPGNKPTVYIKMKNAASCAIVVTISGKVSQTLNLGPGQEDGFLVPKGDYTIASNVCGSQFQIAKNFQQDIGMTLRSK